MLNNTPIPPPTGGTGVSPVLSRSRPVSRNLAAVATFEKPQSDLHGPKRCRHEVSRVLGVYRGPRARFAMSCRSPTRPACVAGFVGHGHFGRGPDFATYEGNDPHQLP